MKLPKLDRHLAWSTTQTLLVAVGAVETVAVAASMQWFLIVALGGTIAAAWGVLYKMLEGISTRRHSQVANGD